MAIKADQKYQEKLQDRVKDYNHLDTVEHYSPYGKSGAMKELALSPLRGGLASSMSIPLLGGLGESLTGTKSVVKLPTINPVLQSAGLQTISANLLNAAGSPVLPPPVPLIPPSLFGSVPSLPDLKNPLLSANYWGSGRYIGGYYIRGKGINSLLVGGDTMDESKLKKTLYRNDLLNQMDENKLRRAERYYLSRIENELEEERLRRERLYLDRDYDWATRERKLRLMDNQERASRHLKEHWHRRDEDRYKYKRFRKGSEPVEAWWLYGPSYYGKYNNGHPSEHWYKKYWSHPAWWNSKDPYPYPPPPGGPPDRDWWWYGDRDQPWKSKGHWKDGKFVPLDVANKIQERVGKEVETLRTEMVQKEIDLQQQLNEMKQKSIEADRERAEVVANLRHLKEKINEQQMTESLRHDYIYTQMMNSMQEKDQLIKARTEVLPEITTQPKIDRVEFQLPDKPSDPYDNKNKIPKNLRFVNERSKDPLDKLQTKFRILDGDYLNQVNTKRLDDLRRIDHMKELEKDKLTDYLDRESSAAKIRLHQEDIKTELMNEDILKNEELPNYSSYSSTLKVMDRFGDLPSLDQIAAQSSMMKSPISQKLIIKSHSTRSQL